MNWTGRAAIVTGSASGIGAATAREFASAGVTVGLFDINAAKGRELEATLTKQGHRAHFHQVDVSDAAACQAAAMAFVATAGRLDYLVNNAASFLSKGLDATTDDWNHCLGVNVRGYSNMVQVCCEPMRQSGGGAVVNIASISAHIAQPNRWTYNACKGAILMLTKCQALDLAPARIRVNTVSPGWTWTPEVARAAGQDRAKWEPIWGRFSMQHRLGEAVEIARPILFLCSDDASFITGAELAVDGGYLGIGSEGTGDNSTFAGTA
jgi:NAD(P)-dependent dehydrogenase (short-subunit alcohol dehydrogenase family)